MNTKKLSIAGACALTLGLASAQAAVIAEYNFDSNSASATNIASEVAMDSWVANLGQIAGDKAQIDGDETPASIDPTGAAYHQFSFTVQNLGVGESLSLTSISGDYTRGGTHSNGSNHVFGLYSDQDEDGYDAGDQLGGAVISLPVHATTFDISTITLGNLSNGDEVEFRFYFADGNSHEFAYSHRLDNIELNGVVIPERGSYALLGGCLALTWVMVRRRRS